MSPRNRPTTKTLIVAATALLSIGLTNSLTTGAYFTDQKVVTGNELTAGTVILGNIADDDTSTAPLTFTNVLPIASADVSTKASIFRVWIRNEGTADIDWRAYMESPTDTAEEVAIRQQLRIQVSTDQGTTWTPRQTPEELQQSGPIESTAGIRRMDSDSVLFRVWLPASTNNTFQGAKFSFNLSVRAIQDAAPWS